jgi:ABC-2 type transport system ATP-binding protein
MEARLKLASFLEEVLEPHPDEPGSPARQAPAIEAETITKTYRSGVQALRGVSFQIGWGKIFAYLGRNGSGKTTTVRILTTLARPTSGTAHVAGLDVATDPAAVRRSLGVTMQDAALDDLMTPMEHLHLVGRLWGYRPEEADRRARELLESFGLIDVADHLIATYSGGMRRRLDIATALFNRPRVVFLDEPTTGLDPQSRRATWSIIRAARDAGTTIFLTTQYLEEADELADTVAIVHEGQITASGTVNELKSHFGRTTVQIRVPDADRDELRAAIGSHHMETDTDGSVRIELHGLAGESSSVIDLLQRVRSRPLRIEGLSVTEASLEDVFVRLTGEDMNRSGGESGGDSHAAATRRSAGITTRGHV